MNFYKVLRKENIVREMQGQRWNRDRFVRLAIQLLAQLETHAMGTHPSLTLLMISHYACRQEPSMTVC